jgi:NDP-sugar pyrophosphorylase family protein
MILAAGLGTRLRPLTLVRPKALVPVAGTPILQFWLQRLESARCRALAINACHLADQLVAATAGAASPMALHVHVEPRLLGTAGGMRQLMECLQDDHFIAINGDIVCNAPLADLYAQHRRSGAGVSLLLHDDVEFNNVAVDDAGRVLGFGSEAQILARARHDVRCLAFTGIHFIGRRELEHLPAGRPADVLDVYRHMIAAGRPPRALPAGPFLWREMGSIAGYWNLHRELGALPRDVLLPVPTGTSRWLHPRADVPADVTFRGLVGIGSDTKVGRGAVIEDTLLWDRVTVAPGSVLRHCVVTDGAAVNGRHEHAILLAGGRTALCC